MINIFDCFKIRMIFLLLLFLLFDCNFNTSENRTIYQSVSELSSIYRENITRNYFIHMKGLTSYDCICLSEKSPNIKLYFFLSNIDTIINKQTSYKFLFLTDTIKLQKQLEYANYISESNDTIYYHIVGTYKKLKELSMKKDKREYDKTKTSPFFIFSKSGKAIKFKSVNTMNFSSLTSLLIYKLENEDSSLYEISASHNENDILSVPVPKFHKMYVSPKYGIIRFEYQYELIYDCIIERQ